MEEGSELSRIARAATTTKVTFTELPKKSNRLQAVAALEVAVVEALAAVEAQASAAVLPREAGQAVDGDWFDGNTVQRTYVG